MTTSTVTPEIAEFAQGVRAALADLPAEEVDDLTDGLEADLAEAYAEDLQRELPDPAAYATELRAAAGLPMRTKPAKGGVMSGLVQGGYDAKGRPLENVQLFDQDGNPLATAVPGGNGCLDSDCGEYGLWAPATLRDGTVAWNVFPMKMVTAEMDNDGGLRAAPGAQPQKRPSPFVRVPALVTPQKVAKSND
jgi:hypothetical protein